MKIELTLPFPPSANRYWRKTRTGRVYVSEEAQNYKAEVGYKALHYPKMQKELSITARFYRPRKSGDLDNRIKILLDSLQQVLFENDSQITEIHAFRFDDKKNPRVEIVLEEK